MTKANPILIDVTRGDAVESRHRGSIAIVRDAEVTAALGNVDASVYPRSAIKPLQAMPLVVSGAADAFDVSEEELAVACASHLGTDRHTTLVRDWLARLGLDERDLVLGAHPPGDGQTAAALIRAGAAPSRLHNNCSGKHAGFLTTALHLGVPTDSYASPDSPVQRAVRDLLSELGGTDLTETPAAVDGCRVPTIPMPLAALAQALARLAAPDTMDGRQADAARRIIAAMSAHPALVRGESEFDTEAISAGNGAFVTKVGAEGVSAAIVPAQGLGVAVKIDDGARRAADVAMAHVLDALGLLDSAGKARLQPWLPGSVNDTRGEPVGEIRPTAAFGDWLDGLTGS